MNVLLIMADQLSAAALGAYGHPTVKTPHIDELAERGMVFENCYCNSPLCVPSRASMVTGRFVGNIRSYDNGSELPASVPTFMHHLRSHGYRTILSGKMHFIGPDQLHGFEERLTTDIYPSGLNWTPDWRRGAYGNPGASVRQLTRSGPCQWGLQLDYDEETHFRALERLRSLARERDRKPFLLCASYTHPHDPFVITPEYWDLYSDDDVIMPAAPSRPTAEMHPFEQWLQIHHEVDQYSPTEERIRRTRRAYYGMVSYFDRKVGELAAELERLGMADDTAIIITSDHGEMLGEHGMWFKRTYHERSSRVPLVVAMPGGKSRHEQRVVSLVDLFPTLLEIAGLSPAEHELDGDSFAAAFRDELGGWKDRAMIEYFGEGILSPMRAVRQDRYKYVYVHNQPDLLFDLETDPLEQYNLVADDSCEQTRDSLREAVLNGWDPDRQTADILCSQQERLLILQAQRNGRSAPWDYHPRFDATRMYVREGHVTDAAL